MSRVFIAGILGFCGSHLCDALKAAGHYVVGLDNESQSTVSPTDSSADMVHLNDLANLSMYNREHYDYVFHCASPAGPARIRPGYALLPIIEGTRLGLEFAARVGARFIKFSSSEVYGRVDAALSEDLPVQVSPAYDARSEYALGFLAAECLCFNHSWPDVQVLRLFNVVGPRQRAEAGVVLPRFVKQVLTGESLTIFGDGSQQRTFTDISDLTSFCLALMEHWPHKKGIWNVANPDNEIEILTLGALVAIEAGLPTSATYVDGKVLGGEWRDGVPKTRVDISKARSLGWKPQVGIREIIQRVLEAERCPA